MGLFDKKEAKKSKFALAKKEYFLSEESALEILMPLLELYDFDIDGEINEELRNIKEATATNLLEYFRLGVLQLASDNITIIQTLQRPPAEATTIEYREFKAEDKMAMDSFKTTELQQRAIAVVSSVSGLPIQAFKALKKYDNTVAENIGILFLL